MNLQESIRRILREELTKDKNLYGKKLKVCSKKPMTGYYRDGYCRTGDDDTGSHTVCARVTEEFLEFTNSKGNNLDMLEPGDKWCLCAKRWEEANKEGVAPEMIKSSTNIKTFDIIDSEKQKINESKTSQHLKLITNLLDPLKKKDCLCDIKISFDVEENYYNIYLVFSHEELHDKFSDVMWMRNHITEMMNEVKMELKAFLPIRNVFIGYYTKPNCEWSPLNESEDENIEKNLNVLRTLISMFDYSEVCDMWIEYDPEDGYYAIKSKMNTKNHNTKRLQKEFDFLEESIQSLGLKAYIYHPYWVEECEDKNELNESEQKKSGLLRVIEEDGLFQVMQDTGLTLPQIYTKTGEIPREVFERFIKDFIKHDGYSPLNGLYKLAYEVEISNNKYVDTFYLYGDSVTVEIKELDLGMMDINSGGMEYLENLTDEEIFNIVDDITSWYSQNNL